MFKSPGRMLEQLPVCQTMNTDAEQDAGSAATIRLIGVRLIGPHEVIQG
ncbi:hypothetical protein ACFZ8E_26855 [Methylobacterium sp. HMF5984]